MKFESELYCSDCYLDAASNAKIFLRDEFREKIVSATNYIQESGADAVTFWCAADWILYDEEWNQHVPLDHDIELCSLKVMRGGFRFVLPTSVTTVIYDTDILTLEDEVK